MIDDNGFRAQTSEQPAANDLHDVVVRVHAQGDGVAGGSQVFLIIVAEVRYIAYSFQGGRSQSPHVQGVASLGDGGFRRWYLVA